jgi:flavin-dependent dehydrogenase
MSSDPPPSYPALWDVVIIGGALSGSATAIQLKQAHPDLHLLVIERSELFSRRVGESTVEVSSWFLMRTLGLTEYLNQSHLVKQGLRFWFANEQAQDFDSCSEIGPKYTVNLPAYQVDRAQLDENLLAKARSMGITIWRPAEVKQVALVPGGHQTIQLKRAGSEVTIHSRWVVDASGTARFLARKNQWTRSNLRHPIASVWARWKGVRGWDDAELCREHPAYASRCFGIRHTATNHLIGKGWWSWWIPLKGGDMSVGIVYDERLVTLPPGDTPMERMRRLLAEHPLADRLLAQATHDENDVHWRRNLPYTSQEMFGDGFALVGDAAAFIDPFYSPGMDWIAFSTASTTAVILKERRGEMLPADATQLNDRLRLSYTRWFEAIYQDKYFYMGDFELMRLAFALDLGLYYLGVVSQPLKHGQVGLETPPFTGPHTTLPFKLIRCYNRRLAAIGQRRMQTGEWGRRNANHYQPFVSYRFNAALIWRLLVALARWGALELTEGWKTWLSSTPKPQAGQGDLTQNPKEMIDSAEALL